MAKLGHVGCLALNTVKVRKVVCFTDLAGYPARPRRPTASKYDSDYHLLM